MDAANVQELRVKVQGIVTRIRQDPEFAAQLQADPRGTLLAAGMPETAFVSPEADPDVHGYIGPDYAATDTEITTITMVAPTLRTTITQTR